VLARLGADPGARLLDLGCCFGQDLRMMVHDGAAGKQLVGSDVEAGFVGLGYELFRDGETLGAEFCTGDFFAPDGVVGLEEGSFDFVHAASFFHLFSWEAQREAMGRAVRLLKRSPRSMLFGRQAATVEAGDVEHRWARLGTVAWRHNEESFQRLVEEVGQRVGCDLKVEQSVQEKERMPGVEIAGMWMEHRFCITFTG
jgi:SAM-dependent methyltransferase